ncbi:MAG: hypothetical protein Unbinned4512contig1001_40 [Prokaryotic dsDNA virus sp.]|nr:MAG: hypothetical protein Unbinned4512contig1001_40 [Prokaryotic dsDNA virus sp.]|tara:strand:- start:8 stop:262 length:255 start_codon:yes stop_codon:yes gene_type:complete
MSYKPQMVSEPTNENIVRWIFTELTRISNTFTQEKAVLNLPVTTQAPSKPQIGDVRLADGTNWNPTGAGAGLYFYNTSNAWEKL